MAKKKSKAIFNSNNEDDFDGLTSSGSPNNSFGNWDDSDDSDD